MLKEVLHYVAFAPGTIVLKWSRDRARVHEILAAREDQAGMAERRQALVHGLQGKILEIGCGAGALFRHYRPGVEVTAVEPDPALREKARQVAEHAAVPIRVIPGVGEALLFEDGTFDAVVSCLVLCSVASIDAVLVELRRVLKPDGTMHLIEHVRSDGRVSGRAMDLLNPLWQLFHRTRCNVNRRVTPALSRAGFHAQEESRFKIFCRGIPALPMTLIRARMNGAA